MNIIFLKMLLSQLPSLVSFFQEFRKPVEDEGSDKKSEKKTTFVTLVIIGCLFCLISFTISLMLDVDKLKESIENSKLEIKSHKDRITLLTGERTKLDGTIKMLEIRTQHFRDIVEERDKEIRDLTGDLSIAMELNSKLATDLSKASSKKCPAYRLSNDTLSLLEEIENGRL